MGCRCKECVSCCKHLPGAFMPNEVKKAAEYLKLPLKNFLEKYCIVGWYKDYDIGDKTLKFVEHIYPARVGFNNKREEWGYPWGKGDCIFLENGLCKIHPVKPFECKHSFGCNTEPTTIQMNGKSIHARKYAIFKWHKNKDRLPKIMKEFIKNAIKY